MQRPHATCIVLALMAPLILGCKERASGEALAQSADGPQAMVLIGECTPRDARGIKGSTLESIGTSSVSSIARLTFKVPIAGEDGNAEVSAVKSDGAAWEHAISEALDLYTRSGELAMVSGAVLAGGGEALLSMRAFFSPGTELGAGFVEFTDLRRDPHVQGMAAMQCRWQR